MPELPEVSPGEVIASEHINDIMLRTAQRYATIADRTAENPTPAAGELAYMDQEGGSLARLDFYDGSSWVEITSLGSTVFAADGTQSDPSYTFLSAQSTGLYRPLVNSLAVTIQGSRRFVFEDGILRGEGSEGASIRSLNGPVATPTYSFRTESDTGVYLFSAGNIGLAAAGAEAAHFSGTRSYLRGAAVDVSGSAVNMVINTTTFPGRVSVSTSARKYKSNIQPAPELADLDLEPVTFHHDGDDEDYIGFVADEVAEQDERAGVFNVDGGIENYDLRAVVAILTAKVNALTARVEALEA